MLSLKKNRRRVESGEGIGNYCKRECPMVSTSQEYIINCHRHFVVCEKKSIVPEGGANV